jgi:hypothetical protein
LKGLPEKASNHFQLTLNKSLSLIYETEVRHALLSGCLSYKAFKLSFFGQSQPAEYGWSVFISFVFNVVLAIFIGFAFGFISIFLWWIILLPFSGFSFLRLSKNPYIIFLMLKAQRLTLSFLGRLSGDPFLEVQQESTFPNLGFW